MAASSLFRLVIVIFILITLALTSSMAWGSLSEIEEQAVSIQSVQPPGWLDFERFD